MYMESSTKKSHLPPYPPVLLPRSNTARRIPCEAVLVSTETMMSTFIGFLLPSLHQRIRCVYLSLESNKCLLISLCPSQQRRQWPDGRTVNNSLALVKPYNKCNDRHRPDSNRMKKIETVRSVSDGRDIASEGNSHGATAQQRRRPRRRMR